MRKAALGAISELLDSNDKIVFIGSDLGAGTLADARSRHPKRVLMEGIAEQHLIGFAAGLALEGFIPYVHTIGTFLTRRAIEQVIIDVALHNLPVRLVASGGGMVYAPLGPTHQAIDDFALMRAIPNMMVVAPADPHEMRDVIFELANYDGPAYIRVGKGGEPDATSLFAPNSIGKIRQINNGHQVAILTTGSLLQECTAATTQLETLGLSVGLYHVPYIAPLDRPVINQLIDRYDFLVVVEEHLPHGGLSTAIAEIMAPVNCNARLRSLTLPNQYASNYGSQREHQVASKLTSDGIVESVQNYFSN